MTTIEWTERTINPSTGCDKVSPGCDNCYALAMAGRLKAMGQVKYQTDGDPRTSGPGFGFAMHPAAMQVALRTRKPTMWFVNSMSDLFHAKATREFLAGVFAVMARTPQHTYQILTKRPQRMPRILGNDGQTLLEATTDEATAQALYDTPWPLPNVWLGTSIENQEEAERRLHHLRATPAAVRFLSCEPLLGPIDLAGELDGIHWAIVGGESGKGARPMDPAWAQRIVDDCRAAGVRVFVKQLGTVLGGKAHHDIDTFPAGLQYREYPTAGAA